MTPASPPRRFTDLDVIRHAVVIFRDSADPVRAAVSDWLRDVVTGYDDLDEGERTCAVHVARAAFMTPPLDPPCQPDCLACHPAGGAA